MSCPRVDPEKTFETAGQMDDQILVNTCAQMSNKHANVTKITYYLSQEKDFSQLTGKYLNRNNFAVQVNVFP